MDSVNTVNRENGNQDWQRNGYSNGGAPFKVNLSVFLYLLF